MLILLAGVLLLLPGLMTDVLGMTLLLPWTRRFILACAERALSPASAYTVPLAQHPQAFRAGVEDDREDELPASIGLPSRTRAA